MNFCPPSSVFSLPDSLDRSERESMDYDVVIVGGGPAGLSCAIRLKQLNNDIKVCILEKGASIGSHLLSGAVLDPRALTELIPDWKSRSAPLDCPVTSDEFVWWTENYSFPLPVPPQMRNEGNYIISLVEFARWLAEQAEGLGVEIYSGFAGTEVLLDERGEVCGIATGAMGLLKNGEHGPHYQSGINIFARHTVLAEGCHGSLSKAVIAHFQLRAAGSFQTYALGVKEIWEIEAEKSRPGHVMHSVGWPLENDTYGGSWLYHMDSNLVSIGFVVGLDYSNPTLSPFEEMQRHKLHPSLRILLDGGRRIAYGAKALVEGGLNALPKLTFPGGLLIGDAAGFLNIARIKGNHTAMKSGMLAAESIADSCAETKIGSKTYKEADLDCSLSSNDGSRIDPSPMSLSEYSDYTLRFRNSWAYDELYRVRNIRQGFRFGRVLGMAHAALQTLGLWRIPYNLHHKADYKGLQPILSAQRISYPKPDGTLTFDRLSSVLLTNLSYEENQPSHLRLRDSHIPITVNLPQWGEPAQHYCPAAVYEVVVDIVDGKSCPRFQINAQNCIHCKTCDIKDPSQNITWTPPQGGEGPNYSNL